MKGTANSAAWTLVVLMLVTGLMGGELHAAGTNIVLAEKGRARLPIGVGSVPEPAAELEGYLERITGADFVQQKPARDQPAILVGLVRDFPWLKVADAERLGPEGFVIRSEGQSVYLVGQGPLGVQHAVTTFLHSLGCRWFFPGQVWEVVPQKKTVAGSWEERQVPHFSTQRRIWYGFGAYRPCASDLVEWNRHNRMGGPVPISIGHSWHGLDPKKDFARHPEWFALVDGKRQPSKPCYSHPEVLRQAITWALAQARQGKGMIRMTPPDGLGYCTCERCREVFQGSKPYEAHRTLFARRPDGVVVNITSETLFAFINRVAEAVVARHPDVLIGCYAYSAYSHPPSFKLHPRVYLQTTTAYRRTPLTLEEQLEAFGKKTSQLGIREYYSVYQWDWDYPDPGKLTPARLQKDLRFFRKHGVTAINAEASNNWAPRGLGYYVASRLMWNVEVDVPDIVRDFYERAFGLAARVMQRYYVRWYGPEVAVYKGKQWLPAQQTFFAKGRHDVEALRAAYRDLDEAAGLVHELPGPRERVDHLRLYLHYLFLRVQLEKAVRSRDEQRIRTAIREETVFGGRLTYTNLIHTRPLLGKAFLRRFRQHAQLLEGIAEASRAGQGWRRVGEPPARGELEHLWAEDKKVLGIK